MSHPMICKVLPLILKISLLQKQPFRGVFETGCSEIMQQIYMRTPMAKCDFNKVVLLKSHFGMGVLL